MSTIRRGLLVLDLYSHLITMIVVLTAAVVLEELVPRPGDVVRYECPRCGRTREMHVEDPERPVSCDRDPKGKEHPEWEMTVLAIVKRA
jgi:hypothetical protein